MRLNSQFFLWNIFHKSRPAWQVCKSVEGRQQFEPWKNVLYRWRSIRSRDTSADGPTVCQLHISSFLQAWNFEQSTEGLQAVASPYHPVCYNPAGWEPDRARVRQITPLGRIYVILMTRVNRSIIKKPCLLLPSGRKWISVSASQQELQNWRFQLFVMK